MATIQEIKQSVMDGKHVRTVSLLEEALDEGHSAGDLLNAGLLPAMEEVGRKFERKEYFIPEMILAARAMREGLKSLKPRLQEGDVRRVGKALIGTVAGDLHDIGKNLVIIMVEGAGFEVKDLGVDIPTAKFVEAVRKEQPDLLLLSALLTTTLRSMQETIAALGDAGLRDRVKVMVGGAPVTDEFARQIGADGYAADAGGAARVALRIVQDAGPRPES